METVTCKCRGDSWVAIDRDFSDSTAPQALCSVRCLALFYSDFHDLEPRESELVKQVNSVSQTSKTWVVGGTGYHRERESCLRIMSVRENQGAP